MLIRVKVKFLLSNFHVEEIYDFYWFKQLTYDFTELI